MKINARLDEQRRTNALLKNILDALNTGAATQIEENIAEVTSKQMPAYTEFNSPVTTVIEGDDIPEL